VAGRNTNNWPDHTFLYRRRVRRFDPAAYRVMPEQPAAVGPAPASPDPASPGRAPASPSAA